MIGNNQMVHGAGYPNFPGLFPDMTNNPLNVMSSPTLKHPSLYCVMFCQYIDLYIDYSYSYEWVNSIEKYEFLILIEYTTHFSMIIIIIIHY